MSDEKPETWPLRPSHSAYALHGVCIALADLIHEQAGHPSRRAVLKAGGLVAAAELFSAELTHFFGSRMHDDHDLLEELQDRYLEENDEAAT